MAKAALFSSLILASHLASAASSGVTGFHIIVARAAGELPGEGSTGTIARDIAARVPDSDSVGLNYPALPIFYNASEQDGVKQLRSDIKAYVGKNPKANIVLLGYDQGAYVIGDVLGGSGANATEPISGADAEAIKGVVLFSDPSFVPGQPYDAGSATTHGIYPRSKASLANMLRFKDILRSYCTAGDTQCASGKDSAANRGYLDTYQEDATNFIVSLYQKPTA